MKIKELMSLELFRTSKLLTGTIGLENEIDSAMVLEALDIENWSNKNQLILTSFYAFKDLPTIELNRFFSKMQKIGVSGLVVKMDRLITLIPEWLIALANNYQIPLIKIEQEVSYEKIMLTIYEPLLNYQGHLLRTYYNVRQRFTKLERNSHSFQNIMETFYQMIHLPCTLEIPDFNIDLHYGTDYSTYIVQKTTHMQTTEFTKNYYEQQTLVSPFDSQSCLSVVAKLSTSFVKKCTLKIFIPNHQLEESQMMILENVIDILYDRLQTEYLVKKERFTRLNNLADTILQNTPTNSDELNSLLEEANLNQYKYYQGLAFTTHTTTVPKEAVHRLSHLRQPHLFFEHYNYTVILYNIESPEQLITKDEIQEALTFDLMEQHLTVSISQVKKKYEMKEILLECLDTIRFNQLFQMNTILSIDDLGIFRYFTREDQVEHLHKLVPVQLQRMWAEHYELFETLLTFFECGRSYKKTAETLFLHAKTIRYRLNKIQQLLKIDLTNPIQLVNYEIGTYLLKTKRREQDV